MASSKDMHRRQKILKGKSCPEKVALQSQGYPGAPNISMAQTKTNSCGRKYQLLEEILARDNMLNALKKAEANKGAPGIDGVEVTSLRKNLKEDWHYTKSALLSGTYKPMPVREVDTPKPDGGLRTLRIPTVTDRMIQQASLPESLYLSLIRTSQITVMGSGPIEALTKQQYSKQKST